MSAPVILDPREQAFEQRNPDLFLHPDSVPKDVWASLPSDSGLYRTVTDVSVGIGAAFLILRHMVGQDLAWRIRVPTVAAMIARDLGTTGVMKITSNYRNAFTYMVSPAIQHAMTLGTTKDLSYNDQVSYATQFAHQIFDYINNSSSDALVHAYQTQLAAKWHPDLAWARVAPAYGLDQRSMGQYLKMLTEGEGGQILPTVARDYVEKALGYRAQRIGINEAHRATEMGKTLVWMTDYNRGLLPTDVQREWLTAEDERVCPICGPMDHVMVDMDTRFELPDGNKVWAPGVHPNCRCSVQLSYPEMAAFAKAVQDEPRDQHGRWTVMDRETATPVMAPIAAPVAAPIAAPVTAPVAAPVMAPIKAPVAAPVTAPVKATLKPIVSHVPVQAPLKQKQDLSIHFERPRYPFFAFANDLEYQKGDPHAWHSDTDYETGDVIDLDKLGKRTKSGESRFALQARPLMNTYDLAMQASASYEDEPNFDEWERMHAPAYHAEAKDFYARADAVSDRIAKLGLDMRDIREIYHMAGDDLAMQMYDDPEIIREGLALDIDNDPDIKYAYLHYMETKAPHLVPGGEDMSAFRQDMDDMGLEPHVTQVLVFDRGFTGGYQTSSVEEDRAHDVALVEGRYRVRRTRMVPLKPELGSDAPAGVTALKYVYLEPAGPDLNDARYQRALRE